MNVMGLLVEGLDKERISAEYAYLVMIFGELKKSRSTSELQV